MSTKFPKIIHVRHEQPLNDEPFLVVEENGVLDTNDNGTKIAIYQRVDIGHVEVKRRFVSACNRRHRK